MKIGGFSPSVYRQCRDLGFDINMSLKVARGEISMEEALGVDECDCHGDCDGCDICCDDCEGCGNHNYYCSCTDPDDSCDDCIPF